MKTICKLPIVQSWGCVTGEHLVATPGDNYIQLTIMCELDEEFDVDILVSNRDIHALSNLLKLMEASES